MQNHPAPASEHAQKRPTGRSHRVKPAILAWMRSGLRFTHWVSPEAGAELARVLFFRPTRARVRPDEAAKLKTGSREELRVGTKRVAGWSWGNGPTVLLAHGWGDTQAR
jgi:hypothetical protein